MPSFGQFYEADNRSVLAAGLRPLGSPPLTRGALFFQVYEPIVRQRTEEVGFPWIAEPHEPKESDERVGKPDQWLLKSARSNLKSPLSARPLDAPFQPFSTRVCESFVHDDALMALGKTLNRPPQGFDCATPIIPSISVYVIEDTSLQVSNVEGNLQVSPPPPWLFRAMPVQFSLAASIFGLK